AVASDAVMQIIAGHRQRHGQHRPLACGIREAVGNANERGYRSHVEDCATTLLFHHRHHRVQHIICALYIDADNTIEIIFGGMLQVPDVCDTCVVYEDINRTNAGDNLADVALHADVAGMYFCLPPKVTDSTSHILRSRGIQFEDMDSCPFLGKPPANRAADTTASPGNNCFLSS